VRFVDAETTSLKGDFQEAYLLQFLAKRGAEKAQLGVFGRSEAIGAVYFGILSIVKHIFEHFEKIIQMIHWKLDQEM
jgi:hypothetical protein